MYLYKLHQLIHKLIFIKNSFNINLKDAVKNIY